jgi:hypothetical protein
MQAGFIASDEFFANSGGTNKDWIDALYQVLLGRQPDGMGATNEVIVTSFIGSDEFFADATK